MKVFLPIWSQSVRRMGRQSSQGILEDVVFRFSCFEPCSTAAPPSRLSCPKYRERSEAMDSQEYQYRTSSVFRFSRRTLKNTLEGSLSLFSKPSQGIAQTLLSASPRCSFAFVCSAQPLETLSPPSPLIASSEILLRFQEKRGKSKTTSTSMRWRLSTGYDKRGLR